MSVISLLSDFGYIDPYVAEMKAVIYSISPKSHVIDISHEIRKFDIRMGAFVLASATPFFPKKTIHVAVVDPGVGTKRRSIIIETERSIFVGPDNGLLLLAAKKEQVLNIFNIKNPKYMLSEVSKTFHGRDIFAPTAAHLANGVDPSDFGPRLNEYIRPKYAQIRTKNGVLLGEVIHIDDFGNIISNISSEDLKQAGIHKGDSLKISLGKKDLILDFCEAYGEVPSKTPLALIGGSNFLEVVVNQGNASKIFKILVEDLFLVSGMT
jgi:S-adenosylmethionine hydrolase